MISTTKSFKHWTSDELSKMGSFVESESRELFSNMYSNIAVGFMCFRKKRSFFKDMGQILGRPSQLCKSKFQKLEENFYLNLLKVPSSVYELFVELRKYSSKSVMPSFLKNSELEVLMNAYLNLPSRDQDFDTRPIDKGTFANHFEEKKSIVYSKNELMFSLRTKIIYKLISGEITLCSKYKGTKGFKPK